MLDKKNAGVVIKVAAVLVAAAFVASYVPYLFQGSSGNVRTPGQQGPSNQQTDARAEQLKAQLAKDPKDFSRARELGDLYWDAGGTNSKAQDATQSAKYFGLAAEAYTKALKVQPKDTNVRTDMATALFYSGDTSRARAELAKVLAVDANHPNALFNLGLIAKATGDTKTAKSAWEKYLKVAPNADNAAKVKQELSQLK